MKRLLLIYWTGTGNTRYITDLVSNEFLDAYTVDKVEVDINTQKEINVSDYDLIGIGYPIYGFNAMGFFSKFIKRQKYKKNQKVFIYKNSGETLHANDASSAPLVRTLKRKGCKVSNEYHFVMPYNIHFRYEDNIVNEMLNMDDKLVKILHYEVENDIPNIKKYKFIHKLITFFVGIIHIGGNVNSFLYRVDKNKCNKCGLCVRSCPMKNIYFNKKGNIAFHHHCEMCMRCSFFCPQDAFNIGFINGWKVNGAYNLSKIKQQDTTYPVVTKQSKKHFHCLIETYASITKRYNELFS